MHRACHKGRTKHKLIVYIVSLLIVRIIHHHGTHDRIILKMRLGGQAIDIRHQLITQLGIILHRLVRRRSFRSDIIDLAARILPVATEQRTESSELIPTVVQLPPFPQILATFLSSHITVLHAEATDIHRPVRNSTDGKVQSGRDLRLHVFPTGGNVTAPSGGGVALQPGNGSTRIHGHPGLRYVVRRRSPRRSPRHTR